MKRIYVLISAVAIIASALVALRTTSNHSSFCLMQMLKPWLN